MRDTMATAHGSSAHKRARTTLRAKRLQPCQCTTGCLYPDQPIDYQATAPDPLSFSAEHIVPVHIGGGEGPLVPAHLGCQHYQGGLMRTGRWASEEPRTSGVW